MGTNYIAPTWRMPENTNKDKLSNYSINLSGGTRTHIGIGEVKGGPLLPGGQTYTSNVTVQNPKFSGSAFINFDTSSSYPIGNIVGVGQVGGASFWFLRKNANNNIEFIVRTASSSPHYATVTGSTVLNANQWYHAAFSWDGNTITLYLNGSVDGSVSATTFYNSSFGNSGYASIGSYWRGSININTLWVGELSQICIFDYALSTDQINYLYNLNNPMAIAGAEPVAYYPLGDNSNPTASAGYPNTSVGADSVFSFDGQNDYIDIQQTFDLAVGTGNFTISSWVFVTGVPDNFGWIYSRGTQLAFGFGPSGTLRAWVAATGGFLESTSDFSFNTWQQLVIVRSGGIITFYINASPSGTGTRNGSISAGSYSIIGMFNTPSQNPFQGQMSNFQLWETALSASEITTLYNNGQPLMTGTQPQASNLKAWYKLNQSSNWEADSVGNWQIPDATSAFPQSFKFIAANNDAIDFGPSNGLGFDTQISISAWFNQTPGGGNIQQLVAEDKTGSQRNWGIILVGRVPNFQFFDEAGVQVQLVGTALPEGQWHHILCTATGNTNTNGVKMYINGQLAAQGTASNENIKNDNIQAKIGTQTAPTSTYYFDGKISNVAVWNTDRSSEKDNIYNSGIPATSYTTTPQYWYKLDNTSVWNPAPANYWTFPNAGEQDNSGIFNFSN